MKRIGWPLLMPLLVWVSCAGPSDGAREGDTDRASQDETAPADQPDGSPGAAVDLSGVDVCEWLPSDLVAATVGGTVLKPSKRSDFGTLQGCEYELDPSGDDTYEYGAVWLGPASAFGDPQEALETDRGLGQEATMEPLGELGDEAYVIHNATEEQSTVHVLLEGRMSLEVTAERSEDARKLAELALSRVERLPSSS